MKAVIYLLIFLFASATLKAEYNGYVIRLSAEMADGSSRTGFIYQSLSFFQNDSLKNAGYIMRIMNSQSNRPDSFFFYTELIPYEYESSYSLTGTSTVYSLNHRVAIASHEIKSIVIVEMLKQSTMISISNPVTAADTVWMQKAPVGSYTFGGYLCEHLVFVHRNSAKVRSVIKKLEALQYELKDSEIERDNGAATGASVWELIRELYGHKVVVVSVCSC